MTGVTIKNAMKIADVLTRIEARRSALNLSESAVSAAGGSRDLIRNWRRAVAGGRTIQARHESLVAIAQALDVPLDWLINGGDALPTMASTGFAEHAAPYSLAEQPVEPGASYPALRALFGPEAMTPATYRINSDLPAFALVTGDVVVIDQSRLPIAGELALIRVIDEEHATAATLICRYLPPFLQSGEQNPNNPPLRVDQPGVTVRHPVIGSLRGIPRTD